MVCCRYFILLYLILFYYFIHIFSRVTNPLSPGHGQACSGPYWENIGPYDPSNIFGRARLVLTRHMTDYFSGETGEYPSDIANFQNCAGLEDN